MCSEVFSGLLFCCFSVRKRRLLVGTMTSERSDVVTSQTQCVVGWVSTGSLHCGRVFVCRLCFLLPRTTLLNPWRHPICQCTQTCTGLTADKLACGLEPSSCAPWSGVCMRATRWQEKHFCASRNELTHWVHVKICSRTTTNNNFAMALSQRGHNAHVLSAGKCLLRIIQLSARTYRWKMAKNVQIFGENALTRSKIEKKQPTGPNVRLLKGWDETQPGDQTRAFDLVRRCGKNTSNCQKINLGGSIHTTSKC